MTNNKILLAAGAVALSTSIFSAATTAATVTATGNANVLTPLAFTTVTDMEFGDVAGQATGTATVVLGTDGIAIPGTGATVFTTGATDAAGSFTVSGSGSLAYNITLPLDNVVTLTGGGAPMAVNGFVDSAGGSSALVTGSDTFTVGATLTINGSQTAGAYTGSYDVTVNYQ